MSNSNNYNLLFIYTDEQALNTLKTYGNDIIETPNLDRLAQESIVFENPYVTQPVCTPSRSSLLTGLYPHTNGCTENNIPLSAEVPCLPEMGDFSEYKTAHYGKWHLGDEVFAQHGFEDWISIEDMYREYYSGDKDKTRHSFYTDYLISEGFQPDIETEDGYKAFSRGFSARLPERYSKPAFLGRKASNFIKNNQDNPFLLYVNFLEPHMPYFSCRDDQYCPEEVPLPENFEHELGEEAPLKLRLFRKGYYENGHSGLSLKTKDDWKKMISNYWGLVSLVDTHIGKILDSLEKTGTKENTIIVFTSDHGDMMGAHRLLAKCNMFEEAVQVPLLLKIPGLESQKIEDPVSQIDMVPTLLDAMGQNIPDSLQGQSWLPSLQNHKDLKEKDVFIEWNGPNTGFGNEVRGEPRMLDCWKEMVSERSAKKAIQDPVRTVVTASGWKFNWRKSGINQLYNLNEDPYERKNLIDSNKDDYRKLVKKFKNKIKNWQKRTEDQVKLD